MLRNHSAANEIGFACSIWAVIDKGLENTIRKLLPDDADPYAAGAVEGIRGQLNDWITALWPSEIRPRFQPQALPATVYLQTAIAARFSPYFDCVRESALRHARRSNDTSLLEAVEAADKAGLDPSKPSFLLGYCESSDPQRPPFNNDSSQGIPDVWLRQDPEDQRSLFRWRLAGLLEGALKDGKREVSAWDLFAVTGLSQKKDWSWRGEELARFEKAAEGAEVAILKAPAACIAFFCRGLADIFLNFKGRNVLFAGADDAARELVLREIDRGSDQDAAEPTRLGSLALCFREMRYDAAEEMLTGLARLFSSLKSPLPSPSGNPAYQRFLEMMVLHQELLKAKWWMPAHELRITVPNFKPEALSALRLFGKGLPPGYGKGAGALACGLAESRRLNKVSADLRQSLSPALTAEGKARVIFAAPKDWRKLISENDPFFAQTNWRVLLKAGRRDLRARIREQLAEETDAGVYLRFAAEHLPAGERGLGWLGDDGLAQRFIGDFKGTELWERAGGVTLEDESLEALCRAWGSAPEGAPIEQEAKRIIALGLEDDQLLGCMATKAGLERRGGKLFQALLKANRFFDTDVLGPEGSLRALKRFQKSANLYTARRATGLILQKFPEPQAIERAHDLLAKDACWIGGPLRSEAELPILFGEYRRDSMGLADALSKVKFPEALVKEKLLAYVKELQAVKAPYMVQASFGLFAGLWPDPNAKLVKWLVAAADWKENRATASRRPIVSSASRRKAGGGGRSARPSWR